MIHKILQIVLITIVLFCSSVLAATKSAKSNMLQSKTKEMKTFSNNTINQISISPYAGIRHDFLQWSFGSRHLPRLSELTWKNKIAEVGIEILTEPIHGQFNFLGLMKYGKILDDSENQDSDWDIFGEFSRTFSKVKGNTFDISGAVGISQDRFSKFPYAFITHYFGFDYNYSNNRQHGLISSIRRQQFTPIILPTGEIFPKSKLVSTYKYHNFAPWYGINLHYKLNDKLSFAPFIKAYIFGYRGEADWILRTDLAHPSFKHKVFGVGLSLDAKLLYKATNSLDIFANVGIKRLALINGTETKFFNDRESSSIKLNDLRILTKTLSIGAKYKF